MSYNFIYQLYFDKAEIKQKTKKGVNIQPTVTTVVSFCQLPHMAFKFILSLVILQQTKCPG